MGKQCCDKIGYLLFTLYFIRFKYRPEIKQFSNAFSVPIRLTHQQAKQSFQLRSSQNYKELEGSKFIYFLLKTYSILAQEPNQVNAAGGKSR